MKILRKTPIRRSSREELGKFMKSLPIRDEYLNKWEFLLNYVKKVSDEQYKDLLDLAKGSEFIIPRIEYTEYHYILCGESTYISDRNIYVPCDSAYKSLYESRLGWIESDEERKVVSDIFKSLNELSKQYDNLRNNLFQAAYWEDLLPELFNLGQNSGLYDEDKSQEELAPTEVHTLEDDANLINNMIL